MRQGIRIRLIALAAVAVGGLSSLIAVPAARADILTLKDGTRLEGDIKREGDDWAVYDAKGRRTFVKADQVKGLEMSRSASSGNLNESLASLRRSGDAAMDAGKMVERYKQFLQTVKGTATEADAQADLTLWETRLKAGMVKVGPQWLDADAAQQLHVAVSEQAKVAIIALRESRLPDAEKALAEALAKDPTNATALYVRGVMLYRQDKFADARRAFEAALAAAPGHGPTMGNLAVTLARLKLWNPALTQFDATLVVMPLERGLLNNVAEVMEMLPANQKALPVVKRVERKFQEQDNILAQRLAQQGLFRWGAIWIDQKQMDAIKAAERAQREQLDLLAGKFEQLLTRQREIDTELKQLDADIRVMESDSYRVLPNGDVLQGTLPQTYYTLRTRQETLRKERDTVTSDLEYTKNRAADVKKTPPNLLPKYTGLLQIYAAEAAPVPAAVSGAAPATLPSSLPSNPPPSSH